MRLLENFPFSLDFSPCSNACFVVQASKSYMAFKLFNEMKAQKCKPNICTYTALVNAFAREGLCEKAEEIFEKLQHAGHEPDVYAYNALMEAYRLDFLASHTSISVTV